MLTGEAFKIKLSDITMEVTSHIVNNDEIFRIEFSDSRPPLVVFESLSGGLPFWTSIPQGRQKEASFFGARIEEKLKNR
jgi:hypothetical protein